MAVILIVEDDVLIRQLAELMILDWGHHILSALRRTTRRLSTFGPRTKSTCFSPTYVSRQKKHGGCDVAAGGDLAAPWTARSLHHSHSAAI